MKNIKDFPFKLDTPIIETKEIEVVRPVIDTENKTVKFDKVKEKYEVETTYHYAPSNSISCKNKEHDWYMKDKNKYIAACHKCMKNRILTPIKHVLKDGFICDRDNGQILE
jgi:hypothetical protein